MRDQRSLMQLARTSGLLDRLRIRLGLPLEFWLQAVLPMIEAYAVQVYLLKRIENSDSAQPQCVFIAALELAGIALDLRRGRILPPHAAPEDIGERAHRWTYAVLVAALLHRALPSGNPCSARGALALPHTAQIALTGSVEGATGQTTASPASPLLLFRRIVPSEIQVWLGADNVLLGELQAFLLGEEAAHCGAIGLLIRQAVAELMRTHSEGYVASPPQKINARILPANDSGDSEAVPASSAVPLARNGAVSDAAQRFMAWISGGIRDGSIRINEAGAPVHFVQEGMLLVSPRIFRDFARRYGEDGNGPALSGRVDDSDLGKAIQRQVLRAGWHRKIGHGNNIQSYDVLRNGQAVSGLSGVLIAQPERFVSPLPPRNPLVVRRAPE